MIFSSVARQLPLCQNAPADNLLASKSSTGSIDIDSGIAHITVTGKSGFATEEKPIFNFRWRIIRDYRQDKGNAAKDPNLVHSVGTYRMQLRCLATCVCSRHDGPCLRSRHTHLLPVAVVPNPACSRHRVRRAQDSSHVRVEAAGGHPPPSGSLRSSVYAGGVHLPSRSCEHAVKFNGTPDILDMGRTPYSSEVQQPGRTTPALSDRGHTKQPGQAAAVLGRVQCFASRRRPQTGQTPG